MGNDNIYGAEHFNPESTNADQIAQHMGFEAVEYGLDEDDVCEKCGNHPEQLYFGNQNYWDSREGEYWCADCIKKRYDADQAYIKEMDAKLKAEMINEKR